MKYTRSLFGLAMLLGLTVVVAANIPESIYAQMNMSAPSGERVTKQKRSMAKLEMEIKCEN